ncbi:hypothetical protein Ferp_0696 [Ferroglobus placidus DSM 10642]|uniref:Uncharacterized protein n=1 Tax=Ferroglobus placidus (strain DSM 10642 / AEDII12DO) TaxID=589924 RepID=D3RWK3_FERPA|nr:hypothetical protein [Ferroglobus placidus]ADC64866.1 hypothetical protein Ferp_0696 [Ferroglobus placidus DSM 10642]
MKCVSCGRELKEDEEGISWRRCTICKKPVCFDDIHYIGTWMRTIYRDYVDVIPVCENELPKRRIRRLVEEKLE